MQWRKLITLIGGVAIRTPRACHAQDRKSPPKRVGLLTQAIPCPLQGDDLIVRRLGELGWIEGQTIVIDCVSAVGRLDQVPALWALQRLRQPYVRFLPRARGH